MTIPATVAPIKIVPTTFRHNGQDNPNQRARHNEDASRQALQPRAEFQATEHIFRGELLDEAVRQQRHRPQPGQQVLPQNRVAIESYLASDDLNGNHDPRGRLLDRYV